MKKENGITLVALVISIIVLLILATVSISLVFNNGILDEAKSAVDKYSEGEIEEQIKFAYIECQMKNFTDNLQEYSQYLKEKLEKIYGQNKVSVKKISDNGYYINIQDVGIYTINNGITAKTEEKIFAIDILQEGDYVYYTDSNNNKTLCRVLYDNSSDYGVQIITQNTLGTALIGKDDTTINTTSALNTSFTLNNASIDDNFKKSVYSYNNGIETLNKIALNYSNPNLFSNARCVGSDPKDFNKESQLKTYSVSSTNSDNQEWSFSGEFKSEDSNYKIDVNQMKKLGIFGSNGNYYLCSRKERVYSYGFSFGFRKARLRNNAWEDYYEYFIYDNKGHPSGGNQTSYFRPVFILKEGTIIENNDKDGKSEEDAYELTYIH